MKMRKMLGFFRRFIYNTYDTAMYHRWQNTVSTGEALVEFTYEPLISIVVPVYDTDLAFFDVMVNSVIDQTYQNWELVLVDDASPNENIRERIKYYANLDKRIVYRFLKKNHHIAGATNEAIKIAKGDFIGLLDHDDVLHEAALFEVIKALNTNEKLEFIYTDEDKIVGFKHTQPFFKPDMNVELLHSVNYITHFVIIKKATLDKIGYERGKFNGAQDWELFLRIAREVHVGNIYHIPKILYSWRIHELSTAKDMGVKPYVLKAQEMAITADLEERSVNPFSLSLNKKYSGQWCVSYASQKKPISILFVNELSEVKKNQLKQYDAVAVIKDGITEYKKQCAQNLAPEVLREDIGLAITGLGAATYRNLNALLDLRRIQLIKLSTHVAISKHIYATTRYNLPIIEDYAIAIVATDKLKKQEELRTIPELSHALSTQGLKHVSIPYKDLV